MANRRLFGLGGLVAALLLAGGAVAALTDDGPDPIEVGSEGWSSTDDDERPEKVVLDVTGAGRVELHLADGVDAQVRPSGSSVIVESGEAVTLAGADVDGDLRVTARNVVVEGAVDVAGDLELEAAGSLSLTDDPRHPLEVSVAGALELTGTEALSITAMSDPASWMRTGGDVSLRGPSPIGFDARLASGGGFRAETFGGEPAALDSPDDPIVLAAGDVSFGNYNGASLHVLAGGRVTTGSITVTGTDPSGQSVNPSNGTTFNASDPVSALASVELSRTGPLTVDGSARPTVDIRAGIDWTTFSGGAPGLTVTPDGAVNPTTGPATGSRAQIGSVTVHAPDGMVLLTNAYRPATGLTAEDVTASTIETSQSGGSLNGGDVHVESRSDVETGRIRTAAYSDTPGTTAGSGGTITVVAPDGHTNTGHLTTSSFGFGVGVDAGSAGYIVLEAGRGHTFVSSPAVLRTSSVSSDGNAGEAGSITVDTGGDLVFGVADAESAASNGSTGSAGSVAISTDGDLTISGLKPSIIAQASGSVDAGNGGAVELHAGGNLEVADLILASSGSTNGPTGDAGPITASALTGDITLGSVTAASKSGDGGAVAMSAPQGTITTGAVTTNTPAGDSGDVTATAHDTITLSSVSTSSTPPAGGDAGNGGDVTLISEAGDLAVHSPVAASSGSNGVGSSSGTGGNITLRAPAGEVTTGDLNAHSGSTGGSGAGSAGDIVLEARDGHTFISSPGTFRSSSVAMEGDVGDGGTVTVDTGGDLTFGRVNVQSVSSTGTAGNAGTVDISTGGDLTINGLNPPIIADANGELGSGDGGNVGLHAGGDLTVSDTIITSASSTDGTTGDGGPITATALTGDVSLRALRATSKSGDGGDITLSAPAGGITTGVVNTNTHVGDSGDVTASAHDTITISSVSTSATNGGGLDAGNAGDITLTSQTGDVIVSSRIAPVSDTSGTGASAGDGGDVTLRAAAGRISTGTINTSSNGVAGAGSAGDIVIEAEGEHTFTISPHSLFANSNSITGRSGDGGSITVDTGGDLTIEVAVASSNGGDGIAGSTGSIRISTTGDLTISGQSSRVSTMTHGSEGAGSAGDIDLHAGGNLIVNGTITASTTSADGATGDAGSITLTASGTASTGDLLAESSDGSGGDIDVTANRIRLGGSTDSATSTGSPGGAITLTHGGGGTVPFVVGNDMVNGSSGRLTTGDATIEPSRTFLYTHHEEPNLWIVSIDPPLDLSTSFDPAVVPQGDTVEVSVALTHTGGEPFTSVVASHDDCALDGPSGDIGDDGVLSDGETWTWTCTLSAGDDDFESSVTVTADDHLGVEHELTDIRTVTVVDVTAPEVSITDGPPLHTNVPSAELTFTSDDPTAQFTCTLDGDTSPCTSPFTSPLLDDGVHTFSVVATDPAGNTSAAATWHWTVTTVAPMVTMSSGPPALTADRDAVIIYSTNDGSDNFTCTLDGIVTGPCTSIFEVTGLSDGPHTFSVVVTDLAGNTSEPGTWEWTVDTGAPDVTITDGPPALTNDPVATITFTSDDGTATFACTLDGTVTDPCTSPFQTLGLPDGAHSFSVVATDLAGNTGAPATWEWEVDTEAPDVTITDGPEVIGNDPDATITFESSIPGATFTCTLDGTVTDQCTSPFVAVGLPDGPHTFSVVATDAAGNTSEPATWEWTLDTVAPEVTITEGPATITNDPDAVITFSSDDGTASFVCTLNGTTAPCTSPFTALGLSDGPHAFSVVATDPAGNASAAATHEWTVDVVAPTVTITDGPDPITNDTDPVIAFSSDDDAATFACTLDGTVTDPCSSPFEATGLADGGHTFSVVATDPAGNTGEAATWEWVLDTAEPVITLSDAPEDSTDTTATFVFEVDDELVNSAGWLDGRASARAADLNVTCSLDGEAAEPCTSPAVYEGLTVGEHRWTVAVTDAAGNVSSMTHRWTVQAPPPAATPEVTAPPAAAGPPPVAATTQTTQGVLPRTGAQVLTLVAVALMLTAAGTVLAGVSRRLRHTRS